MKYLIAGLGNIGKEYENTRHNIGFLILDTFVKNLNTIFEINRYAYYCKCSIKNRSFYLIKPTTYMNLSGKAVNYWLLKKNIPIEQLLVVVDDVSLPFGTIRIRPNGSSAGHNGLENISDTLGHTNYARLRFGIGNNFSKGAQVDYVLGQWNDEESKQLGDRINTAIEAIRCFALEGIQTAMNKYNNK